MQLLMFPTELGFRVQLFPALVHQLLALQRLNPDQAAVSCARAVNMLRLNAAERNKIVLLHIGTFQENAGEGAGHPDCSELRHEVRRIRTLEEGRWGS